MDNFPRKLGISLLAAVLIESTFFITLLVFTQSDQAGMQQYRLSQGLVKGVSSQADSFVIATEDSLELETQKSQTTAEGSADSNDKLTTTDGSPDTDEDEVDDSADSKTSRDQTQTTINKPEFSESRPDIELPACAEVKELVRQPRQDKYFEKLGLDTAKHPEIRRYQIRWFNGKWSPWYTKGVNDLDWKTNADGSARRVWAYFTDHTHRLELCLDNLEQSRLDFYKEKEVKEPATGAKNTTAAKSATDLTEKKLLQSGAPKPQNVKDSSASERMSEIEKLRARIKQLERQVSDLERQVVEREKLLTQAINPGLAKKVAGKILLQVGSNGEAWYVDPTSQERFYLKDGETAYNALQAFGLGVSDADLSSIPVGLLEEVEKTDSDQDGLDDKLEEALDTDPLDSDTDDDGFADGEEIKSDFNPNGQGEQKLKPDLVRRLEGKILIQVGDKGQAWYVYAGRRHYLKDGRLAYEIMRRLSLGITNEDLRQIEVGELE